jgi:hypothetical protein
MVTMVLGTNLCVHEAAANTVMKKLIAGSRSWVHRGGWWLAQNVAYPRLARSLSLLASAIVLTVPAGTTGSEFASRSTPRMR